jgi:hypothetical protein
MAVVGLPLLALLLAAATPVVETGPAVFHSARAKSAIDVSELVRAAGRLPAAARHGLPALSAEETAELVAKDSRRAFRPKLPAVKVGVSRALPRDIGFAAIPSDLPRGLSRVISGGLFERSAEGRLTWTAGFSSTGAGALRLHIANALLPAGSRVYVYSAGGEAHGPYLFDRGTRPEGFWPNTVFAPEVFLEVQWPAGAELDPAASRLAVSAIVHLEHPGFAPGDGQSSFRPKSQTCFVDEACVTPSEFPNVADASRAIGQLTFVDGGSAFICTGGLMNASPENFVPYLLTANHCFSNQAAATSLEAVWNYVRASCNGPEPSPAGFPRTLGSTILATGVPSDFTLVQLSEDPPDGSVLLGWTTAEVAFAGGTILYRLSNPDGRPQFYTQEQVSATPTPVSCGESPQGNFIYEKDIAGGTGGGSSGSPVYLQNLQVVGQEGGACGTNVNDDCDVVANSTIDGAFRVTFPSVQPWLSPGTPGPCVANATSLCLNGARFRVTVAWATATGASGAGQAVPLTADSGYFWFFNAANIELVVKVLDACGVNARFWVFAGGLTNVDVVTTVTDTETGAEKIYTNPLGTAFQPLQDTSAFSCP